MDWYENPTWKRRPVARVERPIDLAVYDLDGDGKLEIALASGFYFNDSSRGGQIQWLKPRANLSAEASDEPWEIHPIAVDPVVHRLRWADLEGSGRKDAGPRPDLRPGLEGEHRPQAFAPLGLPRAQGPGPRQMACGEDRRVADGAARAVRWHGWQCRRGTGS